jgi:type II secretory ATPase GspE/PulE/Tfp pilus assembly ATPase PilB-like protein
MSGVLNDKFDPYADAIEIHCPQDDKHHTLPLDGICYIKFLGTSDQRESSDEEFRKEIKTVTGENFHLRLTTNVRYAHGFFGYPCDPDSNYSSIFLTISGLLLRPHEKPIGELLCRKGLITAEELQKALEAQQHLRRQRLGEIISLQAKLPQKSVDQAIDSVRAKGRHKRSRVGEILVEAGLVTYRQVEKALGLQEKGKRKRIGTILVDQSLISEQQLLTALAQKFGLRVVDLGKTPPDPAALKILPRTIIERMQVLPIEIGPTRLVVATSTPTDPTISENLRFATNRHIELVVASASQIAAFIKSSMESLEGSVEDLIGKLGDLDVLLEEPLELETITETDSKVINLVNRVLLDAYKRGVSDIHFEPGLGAQPLKIRYRKDGICSTIHQIAPSYKAAIISRIKIISKLDIAERRRPQSGKIMLKYHRERIEYRVEITPTIGAQEDAVLRVLNSGQIIPLDQLGFSERNLAAYRNLLSMPYGIILCVGPTGSGKTTSLHSGLAEINDSHKKIWTAEDPVEITQKGLRQVQVNAKIGFTFEEALRSFLRADPDVIMIGEMRDSMTAKTAIGASLTGHLVLSTLHTNSAPETIIRLIEMGLDPYNFADAMLGILAQRLVRCLCEHCKIPYTPSRAEYDELVAAYGTELFEQHGLPPYSTELKLMKTSGCRECDSQGYNGRIAIHELLLNSPAIRRAIKQNLPVDEIQELAISEGMCTLRMDGIQKVFSGKTDLLQLNRAVN